MLASETNQGGNSTVQAQPPSQSEEPKKIRKPLKLSNKANAFKPDDDVTVDTNKEVTNAAPIEPPKPAQQYSLIDDLKPAANPLGRNAVQGNSMPYIPYMPFQPPMMPFQMAMQMPMGGFGMPQGQIPLMMPTLPTMPTAPQHTEPTPSMENDISAMYQHLVNSGMLNVNPKVYNQLVPGEELQTNLQMQPGLKQYVDELGTMNQEDLVDYYQELLMQEYVTRPEHSFGDHSHHHTYSDLEEAEFFEDFEHEGDSHGENPSEWATDPETAKQHEEIRKTFFNNEFKNCPCCKGFISGCGNEICKNLGICHCVVRKQNEEISETTDDDVITECKSCSCCQGYIYKCDCVTAEGKTSCKCTS